jgi:predicted ester cyclase
MRTSADRAVTDFYERYIACLNARAWDRLGDFVAAEAVHNGRVLGVDG